MTICTRSVALTKLKRRRRGLNAFPTCVIVSGARTVSNPLEMVEPAGGKKTWVNVFFEHLFLHWLVDVDLVVRLRRVSLEWMDSLNHALPLLRRVSFSSDYQKVFYFVASQT